MKQNKYGYLNLLITVVLFSTYEVVSRTLVGKIDPFQVNFIRFLTGGIILLIFLLFKKDVKINSKDFLWVLLLGVINVVISMNLLQQSLSVQDAKASVVAVIFSSNPIFVVIFSALMDKEKIGLHKVAGLLIGLTGIIVIFMEKLDFSLINLKSPVLALLSAIFYGLYTVIGRKVSVRIGSLKMNSYSFIAGSLVLLPLLLIMGRPVLSFDLSGMPQVIYLSVMVTGLAYLTYFVGLSIVGASSGSLVFFVKPALASMIAVVFLGEHASFSLFAGTTLVIFGISVVIYWTVFKEKVINRLKIKEK